MWTDLNNFVIVAFENCGIKQVLAVEF